MSNAIKEKIEKLITEKALISSLGDKNFNHFKRLEEIDIEVKELVNKDVLSDI